MKTIRLAITHQPEPSFAFCDQNRKESNDPTAPIMMLTTGESCSLECGFFNVDGTAKTVAATWTAVTLEFYASQNSEDAIISAVTTNSITDKSLAQWNAGHEFCTLAIDGADLNISLGGASKKIWGCMYATLAGGVKELIANGWIHIQRGPIAGGSAATPNPLVATLAELNALDARVVILEGDEGEAAWGEITGTLSSQADLSNALAAKAPLASPALTGVPTAPTASIDNDSTQIATTAFTLALVNDQMTDVIDHMGNANNPHSVTAEQAGAVPTSRTITINGTAQDLSANREFNIGTKHLGRDGKLPGFAVYGQSLAAGFGANEAGTTSAVSARHLMFNAGTRAFSYDSPTVASNHVNLVPLLESISGNDGQTVLTTMLQTFEDTVLRKYGVTIPPCVGASIPRSGQPISSFVQGQYVYNRVLDFATTLSRLGGKLEALIWIQGESNNTSPNVNRATYPTTWADIMSDLRADTGVNFPVFGYQSSGGTGSVVEVEGGTLAQWDMFRAGNYNMVTPIYFMPDNASIHINALSQKWLGAYFGRALADYYFGGTIRKPLYPSAVVIGGGVCTVTFAGNEGQLVLDTANFYAVTDATSQTKLGFQLLDGSTPVVIGTPSVVGVNQVQFTCPGSFAGTPKVRYGCSYRFPNFNEPPKGAGNLHDSSNDRVVLDGRTYPLHNWCVQFDWTV